MGVSVFAWLLNSVLGEGLVKHAPHVISKKKFFMSFLEDLKSKRALGFSLSVFRKISKHFTEEFICKEKGSSLHSTEIREEAKSTTERLSRESSED